MHNIPAGDAMNRRQQLARRLASTYHTNDPQQLIDALHIPYSEQRLPSSIHGLTCKINNSFVIIVNSALDEGARSYARAHELGHALLHDHAGHYLIAEGTLIPPGRYEREADEFAQALLDMQVQTPGGLSDK